MKVKWLFELDGQLHTVDLSHTDLSGRKKVKLDGVTIHDTGPVLIERGLQVTPLARAVAALRSLQFWRLSR